MFSSEKILQVISYLLSLNGNRMNLLKLMKELYLIDRESINERDTSISGDVFYSMPHGPVLSMTLNNLYELGCSDNNDWSKYLGKENAEYHPDIVLKEQSDTLLLSKKDKAYIEKISETFRDYTPRQLENYTHTLQEWTDPDKSSRKIRYYDVMKALGKTDEEISEAKQEYESISGLYQSLGV